MIRPITILSIAGSDNSSGAGIQADLKAAKDLNAYCLNALTVITSQNSKKIFETFHLPLKIVISQIKSLINEYNINGVKIGLIANKLLANEIVNIFKFFDKSIPIVIDPIYKSSTNKVFISQKDYLYIYKKLSELSPYFTPNIVEAKIMSMMKNSETATIEEITNSILKNYKGTFVITGGDYDKEYSTDHLILENKRFIFKSRKIKKGNTHGSGCCFSTALAVFLARGVKIDSAVRKSKEYVRRKIKNSPNFGLVYGPIN
tara:strand:- start:963 stop:1742 length:780 start_codon:yes stop_codon:yes gene_type:complete